MRRRRGPVTEKKVAAELHAHRNDRDEWEETAVRAEVSRERSVVTSFRLPVTEFVALQKAAKENGESLSEFIRNSIGLRLYGRPVLNAVQIASGLRGGTIQAIFLTPALSAGRSENPLQKGPDPDRVPRFANMTGAALAR